MPSIRRSIRRNYDERKQADPGTPSGTRGKTGEILWLLSQRSIVRCRLSAPNRADDDRARERESVHFYEKNSKRKKLSFFMNLTLSSLLRKELISKLIVMAVGLYRVIEDHDDYMFAPQLRWRGQDDGNQILCRRSLNNQSCVTPRPILSVMTRTRGRPTPTIAPS